MTELDKYFEELDEKEAKKLNDNDAFLFGGGYEASQGDYEGACLARGEYEGGQFS